MEQVPGHVDVVFVGAGHNALVAASYLLGAGRSVCLLEQMPQPGGWVRTVELGEPGFLHDQWSSMHPALVGGPVWAELGADLRRHGLDYVTAPLSTASSLPDGRTAVLPLDQAAFAAELERLEETSGWNSFLGSVGPALGPLQMLFGSSLEEPDAREAINSLLAHGDGGAYPFAQLLSRSGIDLVREFFATEELRSLAAPWSLHLGASPAAPGSALWTAFTLAALSGGNPIPVGGSGRLADALAALVTERGGSLVCGVDVDEIVVTDGRASGVRTSDGTVIRADEVVVSSTPDLLYGRLLRDVAVPAGVRAQAARYDYRRGCFQINLSLSARPRFLDGRLDAGGAINLGRGVEELLVSVGQAEAGLLPQHPSIAWHEPTAVDPSRAPAGRAVARLQVLDAPLHPRGDAAGTGYGADGWNQATAEAFADRILAEAELHLPGLSSLVLERHLTSPADLAKQNPNAGPGDHAAGDNSIAQAFTQRPIPAHAGGYRTAVNGVWLIGAATWPGPAVSGVSGRSIARILSGK